MFPVLLIEAGFWRSIALEVAKPIVVKALLGNALHRKGTMGSTDETDRKRKQLTHSNSISSPTSKKPSIAANGPDGEKKLDPGMLAYQNQKLAAQLEIQREEIHDLERRAKDLQEKQEKYDETLLAVNRVWTQLLNDLELMAVRANGNTNGLQVLQIVDPGQEVGHSSISPEATFLHHLLQVGVRASMEAAGEEPSSFSAALEASSKATVKIMTCVIEAIGRQRSRNEELAAALRKGLLEHDAKHLLQQSHEDLQREVVSVRTAMDALHVRHREVMAEAADLRDGHAKEQARIRRLTEQLDNTASELETARRKLVALRQQQQQQQQQLQREGTTSAASVVTGQAANHCAKIEQGERGPLQEAAAKEKEELEAALEDAKKLAARRLIELEEAHQNHLELRQQLRQLQVALGDEQHALTSRPYLALSDQFQLLRSDAERYRALLDQLQRERDAALTREKEMVFRAEAGDTARRASAIAEARVHDVEAKLQQCVAERDAFECRLEEAHQAAGHKETVGELKAHVQTLHKEMSMMQHQLKKARQVAEEVHGLRAEVQSLTSKLERKSRDCEQLSVRCTAQVAGMKSLTDELKVSQEREQELQLFCEMFERETSDTRAEREVKQAERKALAEVERLKGQLEQHSLTQRAREAAAAEAACEQRVAAAEVEVSNARETLDATERTVSELKETLQAKVDEGDAYISEIETIGQAYEEMQAQNRRLLQQITERDEYNTQLVSESVKAKQLQASLLAEKEAATARMHHVSAAADLHRARIQRLEEQAKELVLQVSRAQDERRDVAASLEAARRKQAEAERDAAAAKLAAEAAQKGADEQTRRHTDVAVELERERYKRKRLEEDSEQLASKVARFRGHTDKSSQVEQLQEEIKEYKSMVRCSVCHDRLKEVVITKCFHLFCGPCIQRNLEIRHRKCPGCGIPFGQNDVRTVYL